MGRLRINRGSHRDGPQKSQKERTIDIVIFLWNILCLKFSIDYISLDRLPVSRDLSGLSHLRHASPNLDFLLRLPFFPMLDASHFL